MTDITTAQIVEAGAEQVEAHTLGAFRGVDGVGFIGCDCGQWFGKALEGGWSRATRHVAQAALTAMLPLIRKQLADEVRGHFATDEHPGMDRSTAEMYEDIVAGCARLVEGVEG